MDGDYVVVEVYLDENKKKLWDNTEWAGEKGFDSKAKATQYAKVLADAYAWGVVDCAGGLCKCVQVDACKRTDDDKYMPYKTFVVKLGEKEGK